MSSDAQQKAAEPRRITASELKSLLDKGVDVLIIDARSEAAYRDSNVKIPKAVRVSPEDLSPLVSLPRDRLVVTYCT